MAIQKVSALNVGNRGIGTVEQICYPTPPHGKHMEKMLKWAMNEVWWESFEMKICPDIVLSESGGFPGMVPISLLNPLTGSTMIAKFWEERK